MHIYIYIYNRLGAGCLRPTPAAATPDQACRRAVGHAHSPYYVDIIPNDIARLKLSGISPLGLGIRPP